MSNTSNWALDYESFMNDTKDNADSLLKESKKHMQGEVGAKTNLDVVLDYERLSKITKENADSLFTKFDNQMQEDASTKLNLIILNVPTKSKKKVRITMKCARMGPVGILECQDACSIGIRFNPMEQENGGVSQRWCFIDSILYYRDHACKAGMPNFETQFQGKQMLTLAVGICEHAGFPGQTLIDGASFPCGKEPQAISAFGGVAKAVHLFTVGYTYYIKQGFVPIEGGHAAAVTNADWCRAKDLALATTVGNVVHFCEHPPPEKQPNFTEWYSAALPYIGGKLEDLKASTLKLGKVYEIMRNQLSHSDTYEAESLCYGMKLTAQVMKTYWRDGLWPSFNGESHKEDLLFLINARFSFGFAKSDGEIMHPSDDFHSYCSGRTS
eukprot:gnl/MRDRNA2_/MRDRNA2_80507_c0_seq1.p1 gnl/MRDRNA2_/MRDRNA2_80507_c0~~gnl/MRDRNA2_/MRDRNA2_80507_c0_seq1.p1  ORF type:complete len:407 (-),score=72.82 gnl/MRDRNA2_/MRDRNA2_80507_c0_seq1:152-1303(-)